MQREPPLEMECRRLVILDNGLQRIGDHSFAIARGLTKTLGSAGLPIAIYSLREFEPDMGEELDFTPHFAFSLYDDLPASRLEKYWRRATAMVRGGEPDPLPSERRTAGRLNRSFKLDLERLPKDIWEQGNIILFPGLIQHQIVGLAEFLRANAAGIEARIVVQLMFEPSWLPWSQPSRLGAPYYAKAFDILGRQIQSTVFFATENKLIADLYRQRFQVPTDILPVPLVGAKSRGGTGDVIRIGYFGYSKIEKGFDLLPDAIDICRKARSDLSFVIQVQHHDHEPPVQVAERALRGMPGVRLLEGALAEDVFATEAASVDVVLLPYHPKLFGLRGSGIFNEAVSAGRLIVASEETWAGRSIDAGAAIGETFAPHTSEALAAAILRLCETMPAKQTLALEKAAAFASANSIEAYVRSIFAIARMQPPAALAAA